MKNQKIHSDLQAAESRDFWGGNIILTTSHESRFPPNGGVVREMGPLISGKSRLVKCYNLAR